MNPEPRIIDGRDEPAARAAALASLDRGEPIVIATDTVYGLVAFARDAVAVRRLFELKQRPRELQIAVLVAGVEQAATLVRLTPPARRLAERYWPGPLTLVAGRLPDAPTHLGDDTTIGIRCPDDQVVRGLAEHGPLAATSANRHGWDVPTTARSVIEQIPELSVVIDRGARPGKASTVVDVTGSEPVILRPGPVTAAEIAAAWRGPHS